MAGHAVVVTCVIQYQPSLAYVACRQGHKQCVLHGLTYGLICFKRHQCARELPSYGDDVNKSWTILPLREPARTGNILNMGWE